MLSSISSLERDLDRRGSADTRIGIAMSPVEVLAECVDGGITEGASLPAPALIISTGIVGILFSM